MWKLIIALIVLLPPFSFCSAANEKTTNNGTGFNVLWSGTSCTYSGQYSGVYKALQKMGGSIVNLGHSGYFSNEALAGADIVVICSRSDVMSDTEQKAIVRYVREGGNLLVIFGDNSHSTVINPIIHNFGLMFTATGSSATKMNYFVHPATTERRPVSCCDIYDEVRIEISKGAKLIAGRQFNTSPQPAEIVCYAAIGSDCGKGRVVAVGDTAVWESSG